MKAIRILLSIVGVALTSITFGQLLSNNGGGFLFHRVSYQAANNHLEYYLNDFPESRSYGDQYEVLVDDITYFKPIEHEIAMEPWMSKPFETNAFESEIAMESWMTEPFETNAFEAEIAMESWMTVPFETNAFEAEPVIESWMTRPFDLDEELEVEDWMLSSWI